MTVQTSPLPGGGSSTCQCAATTQQAAVPDAYINGIALHAPGQRPDADALRELAYSELLRQHAVMKGLLPRHKTLSAPELGEAERKVIEAMVDAEVSSPQPNEDECQ